MVRVNYRKPRNLYKRVLNVERNLKELEDEVENKYTDTPTNINGTSMVIQQDGASYLLLNDVGEGDTQITRTGTEIKCTSVQWRLEFFTNSSVQSGQVVRFIIFWDSSADGTPPNMFDDDIDTEPLLDGSSGQIAVYAPYNYTAHQRYRILHDEIIVFNNQTILNRTLTGTYTGPVGGDGGGSYTNSFGSSGGTAIFASQSRYVHGKRSLSRKTMFDDGTQDVTSIVTNSLWAVFYCDVGSATPSVIGNFRVFFRDP